LLNAVPNPTAKVMLTVPSSSADQAGPGRPGEGLGQPQRHGPGQRQPRRQALRGLTALGRRGAADHQSLHRRHPAGPQCRDRSRDGDDQQGAQ